MSEEEAAPGQRAVVPALALLSALAVGAVFIVFTNPDALHAWARFFNDPWRAISRSFSIVARSYAALFMGAVGSPRAVSETLTLAVPLSLAGLSVAFAFRGGLFNIGAAGQVLIGTAFAGFVGFTFDLPAPIHLPLALLAGFVGGALWAGLAGVLKATRGAHEVITTIMLNFIALRLVDWLLTTAAFLPEGHVNPVSKEVLGSARLPRFTDGLRVNVGIFVALAVVIAIWWLMERSTFGFQVKAMGLNPDAARYAGMRTGLLIITTMALAGGLAGLAGATVVLGITPFLTGGLTATGYDAIAVAILGKSHPIGVPFAALFFAGLQAGSLNMQAQTATPSDIVTIIQALIIMFVAAPELVRYIYRVRTANNDTPSFTTSWGRR
ncbi:MAG TPA: ABC transporter permease [Microthrixaceae bacterium]|nr:ABC transporter permease [Microthrixaceae bacterium]